ncbi:hypothetical protein [Alkaliphilus serpentinus]|nr:hypothetical protein [Alkaliphilus serpentinus]
MKIINSPTFKKLISKGYGTVTWGFLVFYVLPLLTIGLWKIAKNKRQPIL